MPKLPKKSQDSVIAQACDYPIRLPSIPDSVIKDIKTFIETKREVLCVLAVLI